MIRVDIADGGTVGEVKRLRSDSTPAAACSDAADNRTLAGTCVAECGGLST